MPKRKHVDKPQVEWDVIWEMYWEKANKHAGERNCENDSIYGLLMGATKDEASHCYIDVNPNTAMDAARELFLELDEDDKEASSNRKFQYSPQSRITCKSLQAFYGDLNKCWEDGWRWYPVPAVKTKSHTHRFYPPASRLGDVIDWCAMTNSKLCKGNKGALDENSSWLTSIVCTNYISYLTNLDESAQ